MYLHIGEDTLVRDKDIIGIFDMDTSTVNKATRDYLKKAEKDKRVIYVNYDLQKCFCKSDKHGHTQQACQINGVKKWKKKRT